MVGLPSYRELFTVVLSVSFSVPQFLENTHSFFWLQKKDNKNVDLTGHKTMAEVRLSRFMAMLLRHDAKARGLTVSPGTCNY